MKEISPARKTTAAVGLQFAGYRGQCVATRAAYASISKVAVNLVSTSESAGRLMEYIRKIQIRQNT